MKTTNIMVILLLIWVSFLHSVQLKTEFKEPIIDQFGSPAHGNDIPISFEIFDTKEGNLLLWSESLKVDIINGQINVNLGEKKTLTSSIINSEIYYLNIISEEASISERYPILITEEGIEILSDGDIAPEDTSEILEETEASMMTIQRSTGGDEPGATSIMGDVIVGGAYLEEPMAMLDVRGDARFDNDIYLSSDASLYLGGDSGANKQLKSDASGNLVWRESSGVSSLNSLDGDLNITGTGGIEVIEAGDEIFIDLTLDPGDCIGIDTLINGSITQRNIPVNLYATSFTPTIGQFLLTNGDIGCTGGRISRVIFESDHLSPMTVEYDFDVYMDNVLFENLAGRNPLYGSIVATATSIEIDSEGFAEITLDHGFLYTGNSLLITIKKNSSAAMDLSWYGIATSEVMARYNDASSGYPLLSEANFQPNITLDFLSPEIPDVVTSLSGLTGEIDFVEGAGIDITPSAGSITIAAEGDDWGTQITSTDATISGDGTSSFPLSIAQQGATEGQVLKWNGSAWVPEDAIGSGLIDWQISTSIGDGIFDTTLVSAGKWGLFRNGNVGYGNACSTHVNLGVACTTGLVSENCKWAAIAGGYQNCSERTGATVSGGRNNKARGSYAIVGGGVNNFALENYASVLGGQCNHAEALHSAVTGGQDNLATSSYSVIAGGWFNQASSTVSSVLGGGYNTASGNNSVVCGGHSNTASGGFSIVSGGTANEATNTYSNINGGANNHANGYMSSVTGGGYNVATGYASVVLGGLLNDSDDSLSLSIGGYDNNVDGPYSSNIGGELNSITGRFSTNAGGFADTISGDYSFAFGNHAVVNSDYTARFFSPDFPGSLLVSGNVHFSGQYRDTDGNAGIPGQVLSSTGTGTNWISAGTGGADTDWEISTSIGDGVDDVVLVTGGKWGIFREGNIAHGSSCSTHVNLGIACSTGSIGGFSYEDKYITVSGGMGNGATGYANTIGGGFRNKTIGQFSTIAGGGYNIVDERGAICGGSSNEAGEYSFIGGGSGNRCTRLLQYNTIAGGGNNEIFASFGTIGGGATNYVNGSYGTIAGGQNNTTEAGWNFIGGGQRNSALYTWGVVCGGHDNSVRGESVICGGNNNTADAAHIVITGGSYNFSDASHSVIAGGYMNEALGGYSSILGGFSNHVYHNNSTICGGKYNYAHGQNSFIGGGQENHIYGESDDQYSFIGGGIGNDIEENVSSSVITGGGGNVINSDTYHAFIGGGRSNLNAGNYSAIPGGRADTVSADYSYAFGLRAVVPSGEDNSAVFNWKTDNGTMFIETDAFSTNYELYVQGDAYSTMNWVSSDLRLKKHVQGISDVLTKLDRLRPVYFEWENSFCSNLSSKASYGFIAQELQYIVPELVSVSDNRSNILAVNYDGIIAINTASIKELKSIISQQKQTMKSQDQRIRELEKRVDLLCEKLQVTSD